METTHRKDKSIFFNAKWPLKHNCSVLLSEHRRALLFTGHPPHPTGLPSPCLQHPQAACSARALISTALWSGGVGWKGVKATRESSWTAGEKATGWLLGKQENLNCSQDFPYLYLLEAGSRARACASCHSALPPARLHVALWAMILSVRRPMALGMPLLPHTSEDLCFKRHLADSPKGLSSPVRGDPLPPQEEAPVCVLVEWKLTHRPPPSPLLQAQPYPARLQSLPGWDARERVVSAWVSRTISRSWEGMGDHEHILRGLNRFLRDTAPSGWRMAQSLGRDKPEARSPLRSCWNS